MVRCGRQEGPGGRSRWSRGDYYKRRPDLVKSICCIIHVASNIMMIINWKTKYERIISTIQGDQVIVAAEHLS
ncbi:hypothetical protein K443DRAFT_608009 [Laccaria amethystina LaAM-08-1]|uniref:Uncharacterized protein n=1 Tax=Laccaria amethystina LaAM-08-1 TaxID=1095629 RepID=A0A0C9X778_9AGAR|nr:hypothetical protein K443DRAFT_608009 [Laccaria amethystina LaAM-08-1]